MIVFDCINKAFYYERFYTTLLFSFITFLLWFLLRTKIKKPIRKDFYKKSKEFLSWYFQYKLYMMLKFFQIISIGSFIISLVSLIQYIWCEFRIT